MAENITFCFILFQHICLEMQMNPRTLKASDSSTRYHTNCIAVWMTSAIPSSNSDKSLKSAWLKKYNFRNCFERTFLFLKSIIYFFKCVRKFVHM